MSGLQAFTIFHVLLTLIQIVSGLALIFQIIGRRVSGTMAAVFLVTTAGDLITGFLFPFHGITPAIVIGILNVVILIPTILGWYRRGSSRLWNSVFVFGSLLLLYFDCLVLIVQSFQKVPALNALAPTGGEPAVIVSQTVLLIAAVVIGFYCFRRVRQF